MFLVNMGKGREIAKEKVMETIPAYCPDLAPYVAKLGLKWSLKCFMVRTNGAVQIWSNQKNKTHLMYLPASTLDKPDLTFSEEVSMLCKAKFAETHDPCFARLAFTKAYARLQDEEENEFIQRARKLEKMWLAVVDIWTQDLRHQYWPELTVRDETDFTTMIQQLDTIADWDETSLNLLSINVGLQHAQQMRRQNDIKPNLWVMLKNRGFILTPQLLQLEELLTNLPKLPANKVAAIGLLEKNVQKLAKIWQLPYQPRLKMEEGERVWLVY